VEEYFEWIVSLSSLDKVTFSIPEFDRGMEVRYENQL